MTESKLRNAGNFYDFFSDSEELNWKLIKFFSIFFGTFLPFFWLFFNAIILFVALKLIFTRKKIEILRSTRGTRFFLSVNTRNSTENSLLNKNHKIFFSSSRRIFKFPEMMIKYHFELIRNDKVMRFTNALHCGRVTHDNSNGTVWKISFELFYGLWNTEYRTKWFTFRVWSQRDLMRAKR